MEFINPPVNPPQNFTHKSYYSSLYSHELGYNVFLPEDYEESGKKYPVFYHLHGWTGNESSEISPLSFVCGSRQAITVFPNSSPVIENYEYLPAEEMLITELIPLIDKQYRTDGERRGISGFSMGGAFALYCAAKHPNLFSSVTAYAGTYHHNFHPDYSTLGQPADKAGEILESMVRENKYVERGIIDLLRKNAPKLQRDFAIEMHVGTEDIIYCDNEILHLHLSALSIPHAYKKFPGVGHELERIL